MISAQDLIRELQLQPHPEGGYFKEFYRSVEVIPRSALPSRYGGDRSFCTSIYFLIPSGHVSRLHRILSDEIWHFYLGGPLELLQISPEGKKLHVIMGNEVTAGQTLQHLVPAGYWFGATPVDNSEYSFVGCTVAPGFDFADFELADSDDLCRRFPDLTSEIRRFCPPA